MQSLIGSEACCTVRSAIPGTSGTGLRSSLGTPPTTGSRTDRSVRTALRPARPTARPGRSTNSSTTAILSNGPAQSRRAPRSLLQASMTSAALPRAPRRRNDDPAGGRRAARYPRRPGVPPASTRSRSLWTAGASSVRAGESLTRSRDHAEQAVGDQRDAGDPTMNGPIANSVTSRNESSRPCASDGRKRTTAWARNQA